MKLYMSSQRLFQTEKEKTCGFDSAGQAPKSYIYYIYMILYELLMFHKKFLEWLKTWFLTQTKF